MQLTDLIKNAIDVLATHGDISVDIEPINGDGIRRHATGTDLQTRKEGYTGLVFVLVGGREDKFKD